MIENSLVFRQQQVSPPCWRSSKRAYSAARPKKGTLCLPFGSFGHRRSKQHLHVADNGRNVPNVLRTILELPIEKGFQRVRFFGQFSPGSVSLSSVNRNNSLGICHLQHASSLPASSSSQIGRDRILDYNHWFE